MWLVASIDWLGTMRGNPMRTRSNYIQPASILSALVSLPEPVLSYLHTNGRAANIQQRPFREQKGAVVAGYIDHVKISASVHLPSLRCPTKSLHGLSTIPSRKFRPDGRKDVDTVIKYDFYRSAFRVVKLPDSFESLGNFLSVVGIFTDNK